MMKIICVILAVLLLPCKVQAMEVSAVSAVLIEYATGKTIYAKNAETRMPMASTTKIMTALLALEYGNPDEIVTVSRNAAYQEGSAMYLKEGEQLPLLHLIYGLMLASGNDAAVAIAEHLAGDVDSFAAQMTERAKAMGCENTQFKNPNGLHDEAHYTTALDLARIAGEALRNPIFREIVSKKHATVGNRSLHNHNKLLSMYEGAIGVKTGYTKAAGRTLVSAAEREGVELIAVTLCAPDDWNDHMRMLDYGFSKVKKKTVLQKGVIEALPLENGTQSQVEILCGEAIALPIMDGEKTEVKLCLPSKAIAPIRLGDSAGKAEYYINGVKMGETTLWYGEDVESVKAPTFWDSLSFVLSCWLRCFFSSHA
ncbi:MAG: D-alanyl-D-alanine carboxypeptidase [Clostridia bacterium]|nr:D-alanyl-D-alanine carboxypeptidase [Clostridia bacterium]